MAIDQYRVETVVIHLGRINHWSVESHVLVQQLVAQELSDMIGWLFKKNIRINFFRSRDTRVQNAK